MCVGVCDSDPWPGAEQDRRSMGGGDGQRRKERREEGKSISLKVEKHRRKREMRG